MNKLECKSCGCKHCDCEEKELNDMLQRKRDKLIKCKELEQKYENISNYHYNLYDKAETRQKYYKKKSNNALPKIEFLEKKLKELNIPDLIRQ